MEVLKRLNISQDSIPLRLVLSEPQKVEQLVEVPTVVSYSSLQQQTVEQTIDIPVPRTRGDHGGLQDFLPDPGMAAPSAVSRDERDRGFFRTFPRSKKSVEVAGEFECEGARALELIHAGGLCGAHEVQRVCAAQ